MMSSFINVIIIDALSLKLSINNFPFVLREQLNIAYQKTKGNKFNYGDLLSIIIYNDYLVFILYIQINPVFKWNCRIKI